MIHKAIKIFLLIILVYCQYYEVSSQNDLGLNIIPKPIKVKVNSGNFTLNKNTVIVCQTKSSVSDATIFNDFLKSNFGFSLKVKKHSVRKTNVIFLSKDNDNKLPKEGYRLSINKNEIRIEGDESGIFYALITLKQIIETNSTNNLNLQCIEIEDYPSFSWRGMHLDVCRHFFDKEFVKKYIDFISDYKFNTFHWHLTEDQGWRIQIDKYPKLTETGAWRNGSLIGHYSDFPHQYDNIKYGGFYTKKDIREIVEYAKLHHVTIVPEIEMPGHALAALASYPELSCTEGPFEVAREWGVFSDVFCPKDETFNFLFNVLDEVIDLFPGKYIHIGGDEVPKDRWKECKSCQDLIKREGLKDESELQSYFIHKIEKYINSKGKIIIGWDEILEGGLAPNAAVMSWRGTSGGLKAANLGHDVVMTPGSHCYFDHYQGNPRYEPNANGGFITVEKVFSFDPIPAELSYEKKSHILGAQANVWTEYIDSPSKVEYMIFPRMPALSEVLWTYKYRSDFKDFEKRLLSHFKIYDNEGINYSKAIFEIEINPIPSLNNNGLLVQLKSKDENIELKYSLNNTDILKKYIEPFQITESTNVKASGYVDNKLVGREYEQYFSINKSTGKFISLKNQPHENYCNGGAFTLVDGIVGKIPWNGKDWLGFLGTDLEAIIDLGKLESIHSVSVDVLGAEYSWIYLPVKVEIYISNDGVNFEHYGTANEDEINKSSREVAVFHESYARFIKVIAINSGIIPEGKPGAGEKAWLFVDEISIK